MALYVGITLSLDAADVVVRFNIRMTSALTDEMSSSRRSARYVIYRKYELSPTGVRAFSLSGRVVEEYIAVIDIKKTATEKQFSIAFAILQTVPCARSRHVDA